MPIRRNVTPALTTALFAALVLSACGSDVDTSVAPDPVVGYEGAEFATTATSATALDTAIVGCTCFVLGYDFTTTSCVSSLSSSGNETASCRGSVSPAPTKTQVVFGQSCLLPQTGEYSTISQLVINSNGSATLRCQSK
jgi:hypothetical protein